MSETTSLLSGQTTTNNKDNTSNSSPLTTTTISSSLLWTTNVASLLSVFLFSGIIFGWAPLELMLAREGQYDEFCVDETEEKMCPEQSIRLQRLFTLAQFLLNFVSLPIGYMLDRIPKGTYFGITAVFQVTGLVVFALSDSKTFDYFLVGYGLMALGGCMTMLGAFPASFLLPKYQLGILAMISCLFDASSAVFFFFHRLNLSKFELSRGMMFVLLAHIAIVVYGTLAICWTLLEHQNWKDVIMAQEEQKQQQQDIEDEEKSNNNELTENVNNNNDNSIIGLSVWKQIQTPEFMLVLGFSAIHILRCNYYIMTIDDFLRFSLGDKNDHYANVFSYVLPSGIIFVPFIEQTLKRAGISNTLYLTNFLGILFGILGLIPSLKLQVVTFSVFTCFRAYLYSTVNAFIALHFGVETMGRIIGCAFTAGAITSLLQYPAAIYSSSDSNNWFRVNEMFLAIGIFPILQVWYYNYSKQKKKSSIGV